MASDFKISQRHEARRLAVQALYQWEYTKQMPEEIIAQFMEESTNLNRVEWPYFNEIVSGTIKNSALLDEILLPLLDRKLADVDSVELAVLRLALYELKFLISVPPRVVLKEAIILAKTFGAVDGYKYVNLVLDRFLKQQNVDVGV